jgi:hypothetical protein
MAWTDRNCALTDQDWIRLEARYNQNVDRCGQGWEMSRRRKTDGPHGAKTKEESSYFWKIHEKQTGALERVMSFTNDLSVMMSQRWLLRATLLASTISKASRLL